VHHEDSKPLVLLVDDSVDVHRLLQARLRNEQIRLVTCTKGADAIAYATSRHFSAILLDIQMPDMDGFEVLRILKENPATGTVPVIIISGLSSSEDKVVAFDLGAADFVTKPFDLAELRARLRAALRIDRLLRLLAERAHVDGLTGMGNRAHFNKRWAEEVAASHRYRRPLSLAMIDADHFKRVNDTFGHPAGDEVLHGLAQMLQRECRAADVACRYGGEEFAVIMPNTNSSEAAAVADRVRVAASLAVWPRHPDNPVTISVGVAGSDGSGQAFTPEQWLEAADRNLYSAKRQGRNRIVVTDLGVPAAVGLAKAG
jgi:diguanylate cyclase (GGDEF)-like protein